MTMNQIPDQGFEARKATTLSILKEYELLSRLGKDDLQLAVEKRVKSVLGFTFRNLFWWRDRMGDRFLSRLETTALENLLQEIPILTKADVQINQIWMKTWIEGSKSVNYQIAQTSGSTGQPVQVLKYMPEYQLRHIAVRLLDAVWQKRDLTKSFLSLTQARKNLKQPSYGEPFDYLGPTGELNLVNVSGLTPRDILTLLANSQAPAVSMNGQMLRMVVQEQQKNPTHKIYLDEILTFADPIDSELRAAVKDLFGAKISDRYSTQEFGFLAIQCPVGDHLHALQFHNYIEILDDSGKPCQVGEVGKVVVTSLTNPAMPLIRYELGDRARWLEACSSGITLPVLDPVITRIRDLYTDSEGASFVPTTGKAQFLSMPEISDFQLYTFSNSLAIVVATRAQLSDSQVAIIKSDVQKIFRSTLPVHLETTQSLDWLGYWKRRVFFRIDAELPENPGITVFLDATQAFSPENL